MEMEGAVETRGSKDSERKTSDRFLVFSLNNEEFAIPLLKVKEVIGMTEITPVPYSPAYFKGIMNLRGQVISVIDLRLKFSLEKADMSRETCIIILDLTSVYLGVIVDQIDSVMAIESAHLAPPPDVESQIKSDYITGVARKEKRLILTLDVERVLNVEELRAIQERAKAGTV